MASTVPWVRNSLLRFVFGGGRCKTPTETGYLSPLETTQMHELQSVFR